MSRSLPGCSRSWPVSGIALSALALASAPAEGLFASQRGDEPTLTEVVKTGDSVGGLVVTALYAPRILDDDTVIVGCVRANAGGTILRRVAGQSPEVLVSTTMQAPGFPDDVWISDNSAKLATNYEVDSKGNILFGTTLAGPGINLSNDLVLWYWSQGTMALVAREGDPTPLGDGFVIKRFSSSGGNPQLFMNDAGQAVIIGRIVNPGGNPPELPVLWFWQQSTGLSIIASSGTPLPAGGTALEFYNARISAQGIVAFGAAYGPGGSVAICRWTSAGGFEEIIRSGNQAPGLAAGVTILVVNTNTLQLAADGTVAFTVWLAGPDVNSTNISATYKASLNGSPTLVARSGDPAPTLEADTLLGSNMAAIAMTPSGGVIMRTDLRGPSNTGLNNRAIWRVLENGPELLARQGDAALPGVTTIDIPDDPVVQATDDGFAILRLRTLPGVPSNAVFGWREGVGLRTIAVPSQTFTPSGFPALQILASFFAPMSNVPGTSDSDVLNSLDHFPITLNLGADAGQPTQVVVLVDDPLFAEEPIPGDINGDKSVNGIDIALVLGSWGACAGCDADLNDDGIVDGADIAIVLGHWTG